MEMEEAPLRSGVSRLQARHHQEMTDKSALDLIREVRLDCKRYWNEHNISDAEIHNVLAGADAKLAEAERLILGTGKLTHIPVERYMRLLAAVADALVPLCGAINANKYDDDLDIHSAACDARDALRKALDA